MAKLTEEKTVIEAQLADPNVYNGSTSKLMDLQLMHANVKEALSKTEAEWMSAQETLDGIA
jgi:ATP-binding cassette subfamily F protein 3